MRSSCARSRATVFRAFGQSARARSSSTASSRGGLDCTETPMPSGCAIRTFGRAKGTRTSARCMSTTLSGSENEQDLGLRVQGAAWTSDGHAHYSRCMRFHTNSGYSPPGNEEAQKPSYRLQAKKAEAAKPAPGKPAARKPRARKPAGADATCPGVPEEWAKMLKAHNDERAQVLRHRAHMGLRPGRRRAELCHAVHPQRAWLQCGEHGRRVEQR